MIAEHRLGSLRIAAAASLWGLWPLWVRWSGQGAATATVALLVAGLGGLPFALAGPPKARRPPHAWLLMAVLGLTDACNAGAYFRALSCGAVAPAALSHYLAPVLVALAAPFLLREPRARRTAPALLVALLGTALLITSGPGSGNAAPGSYGCALAWGGASALFYAGSILSSRRLSSHFSPAEILSYHAILSTVVLAPVAGLPRTWQPWLLLVAGSLASALGSGLLFLRGLRDVPAEKAAVLTYLEPVAALGAGFIFLAERPSLLTVAGGTLVIGAGLLVATDASRQATKPTPAPAIPQK